MNGAYLKKWTANGFIYKLLDTGDIKRIELFLFWEVFMRFGVVFSSLCFFASLFGENKTEDRIYLNKNQIAIDGNHLFVFIDNQWKPTEALFSDANGVYVLGRKWYEPWDCAFCGATNPPHHLVCWNCGR